MFKAHISKLEEEERISTASSYQCALNSLTSYRKTFNWNDLHPEFFENYESFMLEQGKKQNTIGIYLRSLRTIVNQGKAKGLIEHSHYPAESVNRIHYPSLL